MAKKSAQLTIDDNPIKTLAQRCAEFMPYKSERGKLVACVDNLKFLLGELNIKVFYNVISKRLEIRVPHSNYSIDNHSSAGLAHIVSKIKQVGMPSDNYRDFLLLIGDENQYNPVEQWIASKPWDGKTRLPEIYDTIQAQHQESANAFIYRWMISAVAAACSPNGIDSSGVLVLQGAQNLGKTWWFRKLVPQDQLPNVTRADAMINPHDKDSVSQVISHWLVELGELDATFKKAEIAALKSFITREYDIFRRPFAADDSKYPRRTAFVASVNPWHFLTDETGNRRFWTIECLKVDSYHTIDMQQLWAEIYHKWQCGEKYTLNEQEQKWLNEINEDHLAQDPLSDMIQRKYDWASHEAYWREMTATEVLEEMQIQRITKAETRICADTIRKLTGRDARKANRGRLLFVPPMRG